MRPRLSVPASSRPASSAPRSPTGSASGLRAALLTGLAVLGLVVAGGNLHAQAPGSVFGEPDPPTTEELRSFARVYLRMVTIRENLEHNLELAPEGEHEAHRRQAQMEFEDVLDDHELTGRRYNQVARLLEEDAELRATFRAVLEELEKEGGGGT